MKRAYIAAAVILVFLCVLTSCGRVMFASEAEMKTAAESGVWTISTTKDSRYVYHQLAFECSENIIYGYRQVSTVVDQIVIAEWYPAKGRIACAMNSYTLSTDQTLTDSYGNVYELDPEAEIPAATPTATASATPQPSATTQPRIIDRTPGKQNEFSYNGVTYNFYTVTSEELHQADVPCSITTDQNGKVVKLVFQNPHIQLAHGVSIFEEPENIDLYTGWNTAIYSDYEGKIKTVSIYLDRDGNGVSSVGDAELRIDVTINTSRISLITMITMTKLTRTSTAAHAGHAAFGAGHSDTIEDAYDVNSYTDPEDFYEDYEDEFDDYEDAEDYYFTYHD